MSTAALTFMIVSWGVIVILSALSIGTIMRESKKHK